MKFIYKYKKYIYILYIFIPIYHILQYTLTDFLKEIGWCSLFFGDWNRSLNLRIRSSEIAEPYAWGIHWYLVGGFSPPMWKICASQIRFLQDFPEIILRFFFLLFTILRGFSLPICKKYAHLGDVQPRVGGEAKLKIKKKTVEIPNRHL